MNKEQIISAENGNINDSNNINEGNAGRDIITHNYTSDINGQETYSDLLDIIKNQRIVTERLQIRLTGCKTKWRNISHNLQKYKR